MKTMLPSSLIVLLLFLCLVGCANANKKVRGLRQGGSDGGAAAADRQEEDATYYYSLRRQRAITAQAAGDLFDGEPNVVGGGSHIRMGGSAGKPDKDSNSYNATPPKRPRTLPPTVRPLVAPPREEETPKPTSSKPTDKPTEKTTTAKPTAKPTTLPQPTTRGPTPLPTFGSPGSSITITECTGGSRYWLEDQWKDRIPAADCRPTLNRLCCMSEFCFCNISPSFGGTCTA